MKDSLLLRFLYRTVPGRILLKGLVRPEVSRAAGRFLSSRASGWMVPYYIRKYKIDMRDVEIPKGGFRSFNEFFIRKRKEEIPEGTEGVISPCDGFLSVVPLLKNRFLAVKQTEFSLEELLGDEDLAERFQGGLALVFRLTPANYHRYCYGVGGCVLRHKKISGELHCVRPVALGTVPVFARNSREYQVIRTGKFGTVVQMEVGALLVGKIKNYRRFSRTGFVTAGEEKGYFEFGGSTILLLFQKDALQLCGKLSVRKNGGEIPIKKGERVG